MSTTHDDAIARQVATLVQAELAAERRKRTTASRHKRRGAALLAACLVALLPFAAFAANPFTDLVPGSVHNANIDAIYNAGVTTGCVPNAQYCPTDNVTRQEMASFLARIGGLGTNPPVANAKTAQTATNATNATTAQTATNAINATNADTVGGYGANELTRLAFTRADSVALNTTQKDVFSVSITVTKPSYVRVLHTGYLYSGTGCPCLFEGFVRLDAGTNQLTTRVNHLTTAADSRTTFTGSKVFLVAPGTHTLTLATNRFNGTSTTTDLFEPNMQAEIFPFAATGAGATENGGLGGTNPEP